jgi:N-formylglutamate amidohydrolase
MMKILKISLFLILLLSTKVFSQNFKAGQVYFDEDKFTEFIVGDIPLVISIPHGGALTLPNAATRACENAVTVTDSKTIELGRAIENAFLQKYKVRPFIIISHLSRKYLDQNRAIAEATCGNEATVKTWNNFHNYIDTALAMATNKYGKAIYIDLHGHGHQNQRLELGYNLSADILRELEETKDFEKDIVKTSLANYFTLKGVNNYEEIFSGSKSFGTIIANKGFAAVPSSQDLAPKVGEKYFNGGYNTRKYTSTDYPKVFGWQIESNFKGIRDDIGRPKFAAAFADVMVDYFKINTEISIK